MAEIYQPLIIMLRLSVLIMVMQLRSFSRIWICLSLLAIYIIWAVYAILFIFTNLDMLNYTGNFKF